MNDETPKPPPTEFEKVRTAELKQIEEFTAGLVRGELPPPLQFSFDRAAQYRAFSPAAPFLDNGVRYQLDLTDRYPGSGDEQRSVDLISQTTESDQTHRLRLNGRHKPAAARDDRGRAFIGGNKGVSAELDYKVTSSQDSGKTVVEPTGGIVYVQTSDELAYDAVLVFDSQGKCIDVMPPGDYHNNRLYRNAFIQASALSAAITGDSELKNAADEFIAQFTPDKPLSHRNVPGQYAQLRQDVSQILGLSPDELDNLHIDLTKTLEACVNQPITAKPALSGNTQVSVPPLVRV